MRTSTKITAVLGGAALTVATAGVAFAYWTTTGSGSGSGAAAGTAGTLSLAGPATQVTGLVPGGSINIPITASNSSTTTSLQASTLTASALTVDTDHTACLALTTKPVLSDTDPASPVTVAPGGSAAFGSVTISLANSGSENQDTCKNAVFGYTLAAS